MDRKVPARVHLHTHEIRHRTQDCQLWAAMILREIDMMMKMMTVMVKDDNDGDDDIIFIVTYPLFNNPQVSLAYMCK